MKKMLLGVAAAIVALASCSKTEVTDLAGPQEIEFKPVPYILTKTISGGDTPLTTNGLTSIGVSAKINGESGDYFSNEKFTGTAGDSDWSGATKRYWPKGKNLDFIVYSPWNTNTQVTFTTNNTILLEGVTRATDFLYGSNTDGLTNVAKAASVPVTLKHAQALLEFKVNANVDNVFKLTSIQVKGLKQSAKVSVTYDNPSIVWSEHSFETEDVTITADPAEAVAKSTASVFGQVLVLPGGYTSQAFDINFIQDGVPCTQTITLDSGTWAPGTKYIYTLTFTADEILFTPTVDDTWSNGGDTPEVVKPAA